MRRGWWAAALLVGALGVPGTAIGAPAGSTVLVSRPDGLGPVPAASDNDSSTPGGLSADGRYAVYTSDADGFVAGANPAVENVLLRDRQTNATILVDRSDGLNGTAANLAATAPSIAVAPTGVMPTAPTNQPHVLVTFVSGATNLADHATGAVPQTQGVREVWMRDVTAGTTTLVSRADGVSGAPANQGGVSDRAPIAVAAGGPVVAFSTNAINLPGGNGGLFLRSVNSGKTELFSCENANCSGTPVPAPAFDPAIVVSGSTLFVGFDSNDKTLTGDATGHSQVLFALATAPATASDGASPPAAVFRASVVSSSSTYGDSDSSRPSISSDGHTVAFLSRASNLTADTLPAGNPQEAYVHSFTDTTTKLISRAGGATGAVADQDAFAVSLGGASALRAVFATSATNLGASGTQTQAYVRDLSSTTTSLINRTSGTAGTQGNNFSTAPEISTDGSVALFTSKSSNLGDGGGGRFRRVHARTLPAADVRSGSTSLISRPSGTAQFSSGTVRSVIQTQAVSANGRYVVFISDSPSLLPGSDPLDSYVYVRDLLTNHTVLVNRATGVNGAPANSVDSDVDVGGISADGRYVVFDSNATNLSPQVTDGRFGVYIRDLVKHTTTLVSRANGAGGAPAASEAFAQGLSANGNVALIQTAAPLDPAGNDGLFHLYARNLTTGVTKLVDRDNGPSGAPASKGFDRAAIDADGNRVVFSTAAPLAGSPADGIQRVFRRDVKAGSTVLVSRADGANGDPTNSDSTDVATDAAGDIVAFSSSASNLTPISFVNEQIFVRNLNTSHTQFASGLGGLDRPAATQNPSLDAAGDEVAFIADGTPFSNTSAEALVRRLTASTPVLASRANGVAGAPANGDTRSVALDPTGRCLAFTTASSNLGDGFGSFDFDSVHLRVLSGQCPLPPPPPPALTLLKIAPRKVHTHGKHAGARITFHLSTRATVTLGFTQLRSGRRHNGKCVPGRKHGKRCTVSTLRGRLTVAGRAGANRIHISGKLKGKRLPAGRYRLTATPAGGRTRSLTFTVAR